MEQSNTEFNPTAIREKEMKSIEDVYGKVTVLEVEEREFPECPELNFSYGVFEHRPIFSIKAKKIFFLSVYGKHRWKTSVFSGDFITCKVEDEDDIILLQEQVKEYEAFLEIAIEEMKQAKSILESNPDIGNIQTSDINGLRVSICADRTLYYTDSLTLRFFHRPSMEYKELTVKEILAGLQ